MFAGASASLSGFDCVSPRASTCVGSWGSVAGPLDSPERQHKGQGYVLNDDLSMTQ